MFKHPLRRVDRYKQPVRTLLSFDGMVTCRAGVSGAEPATEPAPPHPPIATPSDGIDPGCISTGFIIGYIICPRPCHVGIIPGKPALAKNRRRSTVPGESVPRPKFKHRALTDIVSQSVHLCTPPFRIKHYSKHRAVKYMNHITGASQALSQLSCPEVAPAPTACGHAAQEPLLTRSRSAKLAPTGLGVESPSCQTEAGKGPRAHV
jgi:hypothetical protein